MARGFQKVDRVKHVDFKLPRRSTENSAGYDFYACETVRIEPQRLDMKDTKPYCIRTGVKAYMEPDECLNLYPRSSWPSKLGLVMANSVGVIDNEYYDNKDNEGEIGFLVYNLGFRSIEIQKDEKLGQGIFTKFLKTDDDNSFRVRTGGYGSTGV